MRRTLWLGAGLVALLSLLCVLAAFFLPAARALFPIILDEGLPPATSVVASFSALLRALRFTLTQAALSALLAVLLGLPGALLAARRSFPGRRLLLALSGVPLCVPPVIIALAFVLFYGRQGFLNMLLMRAFNLSDPPVTFLYSTAGLVLAHGFYNFPVVLRTVTKVLERLPKNREEAAVLLGAGKIRLFFSIILPQISAAILSSAILVFLYCFFSFVIVLLFGGIGSSTLEVELYQAARSFLNFRYAAQIALIETLAAGGIVYLYVRLNKRLAADVAGLGPLRPRRRLRPALEGFIGFAYLLCILLFFIGPLLSIPLRSLLVPRSGVYSGTLGLSAAAWQSFFTRPGFLPALLNSVGTGLGAAVLASGAALGLALATSLLKKRGRFSNLVLRLLPFMPLAVSSIMLGFGWTLLVSSGNVFVLILAQAALAWPFAWVQLSSALDRIPVRLDEAALLLSSSPMEAFFRVRLPLAAKGLLSGAGFVFAISAGDATLPLVLSLPGYENLALLLYRLVGSYRFAEACVCAVVLAVLAGFVFFIQDGGSADA